MNRLPLCVLPILLCSCANLTPWQTARVVANESAVVLDDLSSQMLASAKADALARASTCPATPADASLACRKAAADAAASAAAPTRAKLDTAVTLQHTLAMAIDAGQSCSDASVSACVTTNLAKIAALVPQIQQMIADLKLLFGSPTSAPATSAPPVPVPAPGLSAAPAATSSPKP